MEELTRERHLVLELMRTNRELREQVEAGKIDPLFKEPSFLSELIRISRCKAKRYGDQVREIRIIKEIENPFTSFLDEDGCFIY